MAELFSGHTGFEWDDHNSRKNWDKHRVEMRECEEVFFNSPILVKEDLKHSQQEPRFYCLGRTGAGRLLFLVFAFRGKLIRVISARDMSRKEREDYCLL
jgi:uncharacterized DUF497 family protein